MAVDTGTGRGRRLERPRPYRLTVPPGVRGGTVFDGDCDVTLTLDVADGYPRVVCRPATRPGGVERRLSTRSGETDPGLTLPVEAVEAGRLVGAHAVPYAEGEDCLCIGFGRQSREDPDLTAHGRTYVSRLRGGDLAVTIPGEVAGPLAAATELAVWWDVHDEQPALVVGAPSVAPRKAVAVTPDPNTARESTAGLALYLPRVLGRLCGADGRTLRWGRTADGNRLVGVVADDH